MGSRTPGMAGTVGVHLLLLFVLISREREALPDLETPALLAFDVLPEREPEPTPTPPPPPRPTDAVRPPATVQSARAPDGGSPRPTRAPIAAVSSIELPLMADVTIARDAPPALPSGPVERPAFGPAGNRPASGQGGGGRGKGDGDRGGAPMPVPMRGAEWLYYPSHTDLDRVWPMRARMAGTSGIVKLSCIVPRPGRPKRCSVISETPAGEGFGRAALRLWPMFRIRPVTREDETVDVPILVTLSFDFIKSARSPVWIGP